jgi:hypothetical protein
VSVRIHYPEVFDGSSGTNKRISVIRQRTSVISNKDLIGLLGMVGHEGKRQTAERPTQVG